MSSNSSHYTRASVEVKPASSLPLSSPSLPNPILCTEEPRFRKPERFSLRKSEKYASVHEILCIAESVDASGLVRK